MRYEATARTAATNLGEDWVLLDHSASITPADDPPASPRRPSPPAPIVRTATPVVRTATPHPVGPSESDLRRAIEARAEVISRSNTTNLTLMGASAGLLGLCLFAQQRSGPNLPLVALGTFAAAGVMANRTWHRRVEAEQQADQRALAALERAGTPPDDICPQPPGF